MPRSTTDRQAANSRAPFAERTSFVVPSTAAYSAPPDTARSISPPRRARVLNVPLVLSAGPGYGSPGERSATSPSHAVEAPASAPSSARNGSVRAPAANTLPSPSPPVMRTILCVGVTRKRPPIRPLTARNMSLTPWGFTTSAPERFVMLPIVSIEYSCPMNEPSQATGASGAFPPSRCHSASSVGRGVAGGPSRRSGG